MNYGPCLHYDCSNRNSFGYCKTTACINERYQQEQLSGRLLIPPYDGQCDSEGRVVPKIRYSDELICSKCGRHTALVCRVDGTYQAHCMICDIYYDVEIAKITNADRIRAMTDEELADYLRWHNDLYSRNGMDWLDWLKSTAEEDE